MIPQIGGMYNIRRADACMGGNLPRDKHARRDRYGLLLTSIGRYTRLPPTSNATLPAPANPPPLPAMGTVYHSPGCSPPMCVSVTVSVAVMSGVRVSG